jgi:hypothetical protein
LLVVFSLFEEVIMVEIEDLGSVLEGDGLDVLPKQLFVG